MADVLKPWKIIGKKKRFDAHPWFEVWQEQVALPNGEVIPDYYKIHMPDSCIIVALTPKKDVLLLRLYKHGVRNIITAFPAGFVDFGEPPLQTAQRELLEETGYVAKEWISLGGYVRDATRGSGLLHVFLALDTKCVDAPKSGDLEEIDVVLVPWRDLLDVLNKNPVKIAGLTLTFLLVKTYVDNNSCFSP